MGEWSTEASLPHDPPGALSGCTTFEWAPGGFFLLQRWTADHPQAPDGLAVIGAVAEEMFAQHYYDSRGVQRVYQMSLEDGVWELRRDSPGFTQRFTGRFSDDGRLIEGAWDKSQDGSHWQHDFRLTYRRVR